jgi:hypothetical protein
MKNKLFAAWKKHWKVQVPVGFLLFSSYLQVTKVITAQDWAIMITAFGTFFKMITDQTKSKSRK